MTETAIEYIFTDHLARESGTFLFDPVRKFLIIASAIATLLLPQLSSAESSTVVPVALVNGIAIHKYDLDCAVEAGQVRSGTIKLKSNKSKIQISVRRTSRKALERLIDIELLYQEGLKHKFEGLIGEAEERYQREIMKAGGETKLSAALACNATPQDDLRKSIFRNLVINRYLTQEVYSRITVSEEDARLFYSRNQALFSVPAAVRARQILVRVRSWKDRETTETAYSKAMMIHEEAVKGADFADLVHRYSEDSFADTRDGDMGLIRQGTMPKVIDSNIFALKAGGYTRPIKTRLGFHIIQVVDLKPATVRPFDEVREFIISKLTHKKAARIISVLLKDFRAKARIEIVNQ